jgi:hypothetical protein
VTSGIPTLNDQVLALLVEERGRPLNVDEVYERLSRDVNTTKGSLAGSLSVLRKRRETTGVIRTSLGHYAWRPGHLNEDVPASNFPGSKNGGKRSPKEPADNRELADVGARVDDSVLREVGLDVVGRTAAGDRVAVDAEGTLWLVEVHVTARLL